MPAVRANGLDIHYEEMGEGRPLLLVMGLNSQLIFWPDGFCDQLVARGFRVIRFDNRDVGLSTWLDHEPTPNPIRAMVRAMLGLAVGAPYRLEDMAADALGLLDALGIDRAHVVGASMGGMIAQTMAIHHPGRLLTLTSIMSNPGGRRYLLARPRAIRSLLKRPTPEREAVVRFMVELFTVIGSPAWPAPERYRELAERAFDRAFHPAGFKRHLAAILAAGSRTRALEKVRVPTLVIQGRADPLNIPAGGRATARAVPGARLELIDGMGHDLPEPLWPRIADAILANARRA